MINIAMTPRRTKRNQLASYQPYAKQREFHALNSPPWGGGGGRVGGAGGRHTPPDSMLIINFSASLDRVFP